MVEYKYSTHGINEKDLETVKRIYGDFIRFCMEKSKYGGTFSTYQDGEFCFFSNGGGEISYRQYLEYDENKNDNRKTNQQIAKNNH